jgi:hypothetical protein
MLKLFDADVVTQLGGLTQTCQEQPIAPIFAAIRNCIRSNACAPNPCENGGVYSIGPERFGQPSGMNCECAAGFMGESCEEATPFDMLRSVRIEPLCKWRCVQLHVGFRTGELQVRMHDRLHGHRM